MPKSDTTHQTWLWPSILFLSLIRLWPASILGLAEDEAYYWCWSKYLDFGYFDHPPMVAYFIAMGTTLLGDTEIGVRLMGILITIPILYLSYLISNKSLLVVYLIGTMPLFFLGGILTTPDTPLIAMWMMGIWATSRKRWVLLGLAAGLAMMSKYTGALLFPLMILSTPSALKNPRLYAGFLVAVLIYMPNILWNLDHELISWEFQLHHIQSEPNRWAFIGAQIGLVGPMLFGVLLVWFFKGPKTKSRKLGIVGSLPVLILAIYAGGEANWAAPAYLSAVIALSECKGRWERAAWIGVGTNIFLCLLVIVHVQSPLIFHPNDPVHRLNGGKELGESISAWGIEDVWTTRYQEAAWIRFYGDVPASVLPNQGRLNQFEFWNATLPPKGLFVRPFRFNPSIEIEGYGYDAGQYGRIVAFTEGPSLTQFHRTHAWQVFPFEE